MIKKDTIILFYPNSWQGEKIGRIPYALLYLERMIKEFNLNVLLIDEQLNKNYIDQIIKFKDRLILVGISSMTGYQIKGGIKFSQKIRELSDCLIVWGGWHPTLLPEQILEKDYIDLLIRGQGEIPFRNLVERILKKEDITDIKGLCCKKNGKIIINESEKFVDINKFPKVDYTKINIKDYIFRNSYAKKCIGYFCSHGCPFNCAFCCVAEVYGRRWYNKEITEIIQDLKYLKKMANIDSITFDDDNFFVDKEFTIQLCEEFIKADLNLQWDSSAHASLFLKLFSDKDVDLLYKAGCRQIYIGAESGDQNVLDIISKRTIVEDNLKFVDLLNKHNITPMFSVMVCFPMNPDRDFKATLNMIRIAKLKDPKLRVRIFFFTPYPGTDLYKLALQKGFKEPKSLEDWSNYTLRKFNAPWIIKNYRWELEIFSYFYLPLANPDYYKLMPKRVKPIVFIINKVFYPLIYLRFKFNFFKFPIEAIIFLKSLQLFNKVMKTNFAVGAGESYLN